MIRLSRFIETEKAQFANERERVLAQIPDYLISSLRSQPEYNYFVLSFQGCDNPAHFEGMLRRDFAQMLREAEQKKFSPSELMGQFYLKILSARRNNVVDVMLGFAAVDNRNSQALAYELLEKQKKVAAYPKSQLEKYASPLFNNDRFTYLFLVFSASCAEAARLMDAHGSFGRDLTDYSATLSARWDAAIAKHDEQFAWNRVAGSVHADLKVAYGWTSQALRKRASEIMAVPAAEGHQRGRQKTR